MRQQLEENPMGYGHLALVADTFLDGAAGVTFAGTREQVAPLLAAANRVFAPTFAFSWKEPGIAIPSLLREIFEAREPVDGQAAAYVCRGFSCERPLADPAALIQRLQAAPSV
jgi:uncharacterized protein YyaL (SSP411 family)